ncbi:hypothetical protein CF326_g5622, partial [Tilletia indica]
DAIPGHEDRGMSTWADLLCDPDTASNTSFKLMLAILSAKEDCTEPVLLYGKHFHAGGHGSTAAEMASYWATLHIAGTQYKPVCGALGYNSIKALAQAGGKGDIGVKFVFRKCDFALSRIQGDARSCGRAPGSIRPTVFRL